MRELFPSYYDQGNDLPKEFWDRCLVVLDASVLLNLYDYRESKRGKLFTLLQDFGDRLWIPHQVALEYQRNRKGKVLEPYERANGAASSLKNALDAAKKALEKAREALGGLPQESDVSDSSNVEANETVASLSAAYEETK